MRRHVIAGHYGDEDNFAYTLQPNEVLTKVDFQHHAKLGLGIGAALDDLLNQGVFPSEIAVDLLVLATHVQIADTRLSRDSESQDSWTREIKIIVPVADPEKWQAATPTLKRALDFLTGDIWELHFRTKLKTATDLIPKGTLPLGGVAFDEVALFSGGLDSLIGAIDSLDAGRTPLLVSHAGDGATSKAQDNCLQELRREYPKNSFNRLRLWMDLNKVNVKGSKHETTTRGRSFLFFATGILAGSGLGKEFTLRVPENGLIALNVPLDPLRLGSHSTRTTHPFYISRWNEFLKILGINGTVQNPYWNKTKGEMALECANKSLLEKVIPLSSSCSSPTKGRWQKLPAQHCGHCLPCLIRRAAVRKGLGEGGDKTTYTIEDLSKRTLDSNEAEGRQVRSFQFAINRLVSKPRLAKLMLHSNGSLSDQSAEDQEELFGVYSRGLIEVSEILKNVRTSSE
ncbi:MAG TPA: hypothetical protein PK096_04460 [Candidatus Saccharibacteria bacterium]|nr:hypothetical protein [Candidatus Saccharibacteria bacterium]HRK94591.1 hypothetical protein [Candidatus Saccharibacteria bacterium]